MPENAPQKPFITYSGIHDRYTDNPVIEVSFWGTCYGFTLEEAEELAKELQLLVKNAVESRLEV